MELMYITYLIKNLSYIKQSQSNNISIQCENGRNWIIETPTDHITVMLKTIKSVIID